MDLKVSLLMLIISWLMMEVMPLAKNMPASVTIKGCIFRYATRKPCTRPKTQPVSRTMMMAGTAPIPPFSIIHASIIHTMATTEPTEMSMPPVIMTMVMPVATTINPALEINRFRKFCTLANPRPPNMRIPTIYMTKNNTMVTTSKKELPSSFFFVLPFFIMPLLLPLS